MVHSDPPTAPSPSGDASSQFSGVRSSIVHSSAALMLVKELRVLEVQRSAGVSPESSLKIFIVRIFIHVTSGETSAFSRSLEIKHNAHQSLFNTSENNNINYNILAMYNRILIKNNYIIIIIIIHNKQ